MRKIIQFFIIPLLTILLFYAGIQLSSDTNLNSSSASFTGESAYDNSGYSVSGAGDVNGDGYDDLLIGAWKNDENGNEAGKAYLILGKSTGWSMDVSLTTSIAKASFMGENAGDWLGRAVAGVGDVNGDGYDDFLLAADGNGDGGDYAGQIYLFLGKATANWGTNFNVSGADASFWGEAAGDWAGKAIGPAGDVNGDGYDDFLIGAYGNDDGAGEAGQAYLILGKSTGWAMDTDLSAADASFLGARANANAGYSVFSAGDVNSDGYDDFLIGASRDSQVGTDAGQVYLMLGRAAADWGMDYDFETQDADAAFVGEDTYDLAGSSVSGVGDANGDGYDDFLIGARGDEEGGVSSAGQTYLIFGKATADWVNNYSLSEADASFLGEAADNYSGKSVSGVNDVNGDGYSDFIIGAYENSESDYRAGQTYLILGKSSGWSMDVGLSTANSSFWGEVASDYAGYSVSGVGDANGDGFSDFMIGAYGNGSGVNADRGQTYLILSDQTGATDATYKEFIASGDSPPCVFDNADLTVDFSSCTSTNGYLSVTLHNNQDPPGTTGSSVDRYWTITPTNLTSYNFSIVFHYNDGEVAESGGAEANMKIYRKNGSVWEEVATTVDANNNTLTATGQTGFSDWAISNSEDPLPVELILFTATGIKDAVELFWQTATEVNNYGFEIERAVDIDPASPNNGYAASSWEKIGFVQGHGNSNSTKHYSFTDSFPPTGNLLYRLKQID
ncbi:MAG: hypothetical protein GXO87_03905, partial [Chlorobi bacterium]|nr:hypothetical protein [Chlorobiota bacterium]